MKISYCWLKEFIDIESISPDKLAEIMSSIGLGVESLTKPETKITNVIIGKILNIDKHPNADRLLLCKVTDGKKEYSVVCGAKNISVGDIVPFALPGAVIAKGTKIETTKIRGVESHGMLCSGEELNIEEKSEGILILNNEQVSIGDELTKYYSVNDTIIDIETPANRGDLLGHLGIARELSAKLKIPLKLPPTTISTKFSNNVEFKLDVIATELCSRYIATMIDNIEVKPSPIEIQLRLKHCGLRPINNIVDITNYVLLEIGHPLHAFDYKKLSQNHIIVRQARDNEQILALDNKTYTLDSDMLVIADATQPQAIAGIIGGELSGVTETTKIIILESALFEPQNIRKTCKKLGIVTDASYRFERNASYEMCNFANDRAIELINRIANGRVLTKSEYSIKYIPRKIMLRQQQIPRILSVEYPIKDVTDTLTRLGLNIVSQSADKSMIMIEVPSYRNDLKEEIDLIEEIARIQGYETIQPSLKTYQLHKTIKNSVWELEKIIRKFLSGCGLQEVINYTFISQQDVDKLMCLKTKRKPVKIANPVSSDFEFLRNSMIYGLINNMLYNYRTHNPKSIKLFELGKIFYLKQEPIEHKNNKEKILNIQKIKEVETIGILCTGKQLQETWNIKSNNVDFYYIAGVVKNMFDELGIKNYSFRHIDESQEGHFIYGKSALISDKEGNTFGELGLLNPELTEKYSDEVYYAEIDIENIMSYWVPERKAKSYSKFPKIARDISIVVPENVTYQEIIDKIISEQDEINIEFSLFDIFRSEKIGPDKKSLAISLYFSHLTRTLTDNEVNNKIENILRNLSTLGIYLRS